MVRSAYLPDNKVLANLVAGLRAPLGATPEGAALVARPRSEAPGGRSMPPGSPGSAPPGSVPPGSVREPARAGSWRGEPPLASEPPVAVRRSSRPAESKPAQREARPLDEPLGEALLLSELAGQLRGVSSLERGFSSLATWLELRTGARAVFVADAEGLGMTRAGEDEPYLAAAGEIGVALDKLTSVVPGVNEGAVTFDLADGQRLVLIGCVTEFGRISVGLVMNTPLDPVWTTVIRKALHDVALRGKTTR